MTDAVKRLREAIETAIRVDSALEWGVGAIVRAAAAVCLEVADDLDTQTGMECHKRILSALDPKGGDDD